MKRNLKLIVIIGLFVLIVGLIDKLFRNFMRPMPPGYDGHFWTHNYNPVYKTTYHQDTLIRLFEKQGFLINHHHNALEWDSVSYRIDRVPCDTLQVEPFIKFQKKKVNGLTQFKILWVYGPPNSSFDTAIYYALGRKYLTCFEAVLKRYGVTIEQER
jgi:hypothetical protein